MDVDIFCRYLITLYGGIRANHKNLDAWPHTRSNGTKTQSTPQKILNSHPECPNTQKIRVQEF